MLFFSLRLEVRNKSEHESHFTNATCKIANLCNFSLYFENVKAREFKIKAESEIIKRCGRKQQQIRAGKIKVKNVVGGQCRLVDIEKEKNPKYLFLADSQVFKVEAAIYSDYFMLNQYIQARLV